MAFGLKYKEPLPLCFYGHLHDSGNFPLPGETEESCKEKRIDYVVGRALYANNARGHITGDTAGMLKLILRPRR